METGIHDMVAALDAAAVYHRKVSHSHLSVSANTNVSSFVDKLQRLERQSVHDSTNQGRLQVHDAVLRSNGVNLFLILFYTSL
jgi:hypothetical protein